MKLTVTDLPIWGKFQVLDVVTKEILHDFDGEGHGDIAPDVAFRHVIAMYANDDRIVLEVC